MSEAIRRSCWMPTTYFNFSEQGKTMNILTSITRFLQSKEAVIVLLVVALAAQMPHSATVFHRVATGTEHATVGWAHAYLYAAAVELLIAMCVVRGKIMVSWLFVIASIAMNAIYYELSLSSLSPGAIVVSVLLPVGIAFYSHEAAQMQAASSARKPVAKVQPDAGTTVAEPKPRKPVAKVKGISKQDALPKIIDLGLHRQDNAAKAIADMFGVDRSTGSRWKNAALQQEAAA